MLAADLTASGIEVFIITRRSSSDLAALDRVDGVAVHRIGPIGAARWPRWRMVFSSFRSLARLRNDYDVIFSQLASAGFDGYDGQEETDVRTDHDTWGLET